MGAALSSCCAEEKVGTQGYVGGPESSSWRLFTYKELHTATNGFSEDYKLGEGGFGSVYWGKTTDGLQIAVKKLKAMNSKAEMEFAVEVEILGRVRHKNLLGLRGYCAGVDQRLIVYDYMPNLSLLSHLHGQFADEMRLDWKKRMNIIIGSAQGLVYLHHEATPHIIHRDIKASNVLIDSDFQPLVADFGFAKLIPDGVSHMTTRVKGTLGYLAPEYAMWGKVSESCDVYSFGILLLELVSGRKPIEKLPGGIKRTITEWAEPLISAGRGAKGNGLGRVEGEGDAGDRAIGAGEQCPSALRIESIKYGQELMAMDDDNSNDGDVEDEDGQRENETTSASSLELGGGVAVQRMKGGSNYGQYDAAMGSRRTALRG
ncbi:PTI1-like tyrosine-protein kinase At3g15890 [Phalaenopsis equestris]|uniref:PTI1-like tyrosine-protein kinase At3g15890 n=1 Tax=Phalaenopsis equestris TaxID=78828 RepID=UPI0009E4A3A9|nr:PTI1-like tyrosine-protein kinase At3g15890 [Phalaenopsis equestris]